MKRFVGRRPSPAMVVALIGLFVALGGSSYAAVRTVLPKNSVGSAQVVNHSLLKLDFKTGQLPQGPAGPAGPAGPVGPAGAQGPPGIFNVGVVQLTEAEVNPAARGELKAFIPTNSSSQKCLVTPNESNAATPGTSIYCGTRNYNGANGLFIHVFLPAPAPAGLTITMTVYQELAQQYGLPVFYPG